MPKYPYRTDTQVFQKAVAGAVKKWEGIVATLEDGGAFPRFDFTPCALCDFVDNHGGFCEDCPLYCDGSEACHTHYREYIHTANPLDRLIAARKLLNVIKTLKEPIRQKGTPLA